MSTTVDRHRLLVVIDEPCHAHGLCSAVERAAGADALEALVVAPAHETPATPWYVDEDAARAEATVRMRACLSCLGVDGIAAEGRLADHDPVHAIADALHDFDADEILLVTGPQRPSTRLRENVVDRVRRSFALPVEHVVVRRVPATSR